MIEFLSDLSRLMIAEGFSRMIVAEIEFVIQLVPRS